MNEQLSYPDFLFYLFGILGLIFILRKPQFTFWMGIFYFSARELKRSVYTRLPQFGPYLNLDDFILILILICLIIISFKDKIKFPLPAILVLLCIFTSLIILSINYSFIYEVQREYKYALYFLFGLITSYNFVQKEKDLETFLKILFIGSAIASFQYLFFTKLKLETLEAENIYGSIRSVGFISLIPTIIITSFFLKLKWIETTGVRILFFIGLSLMIVNVILSQTRSIFFAIVITVILIYLFHRKIKSKSVFITTVVVLFLVYVIFDQYLNFININEILFGRLQLLSDSPTTDITTIGRISAMKIEFEAFLNSNILFGNGLGFNYFHPQANNPYISWGHIGHIAYLARLGLVGFIVYSIYIPFKSFWYLSKINITELKFNYTKIFVIFSIALIISDWIQFWMSASYLGIGSFLSGTVIGIIWTLKDQRIQLASFQTI